MMTRANIGTLTFLFGILAGALLMRGWLDGKIPFLDAPPTQTADTGESPASSDGDPDLGGVPNASATPSSTATPVPTPTPTLEPLTGPTPAFGGLTALENGWRFTAPEKIVFGPEVLSNGIVNLVGESGTVFRLNPDGTAREAISLPNFAYDPSLFYIPINFYDDGTITVRAPDKIYAVNADGTVRWEIPLNLSSEGSILPEAHLGDLFLQLDSTNTLFGYTLADGLLWQYPFENSFRDDFYAPAMSGTEAYFIDKAGILYAFSREGLVWSYEPGERLKAASSPVLGPDGTLYYVLTSGTKGFLQALSPTGEPLWQTELATPSFYNSPDYTVGGTYIFVKDELIRADTGERAAIEFPYKVDAFIRGEDEADYLLTGSNVIRWQVGANGFESLHTSSFNAEGLTSFTAPRVRVYSSQITEMEYFTEKGPYLVWLNPDGEVMNVFQLDWNIIRVNLQQPGETSLTLCEQHLIENQLECKKYVAGTPDPIWDTIIEGISGSFDPFMGFRFMNGQLYVLTDEVNLYVLTLAVP
ncbi:MAG TPA: PQQ-binding-like beta-propeller repeat protein [Anaerolineales bacterium]|nr:PQQ-binding-like beta-propeller repeat protein [Anaerolineales bacterium]